MSDINKDILMELDLQDETEQLQSKSKNELNTSIVEKNKNSKNTDILEEKINSIKELDIQKEIERLKNESTYIEKTNIKDENILEQRVEKRIKKRKITYFFSGIVFFTKYLITSSLIFAVLLITTNYSAYINIAKSYVFSNQIESKQQRLVNSVEASNIKEKYSSSAKKVIKQRNEEENIEEEVNTKLSLKKVKKNEDKKDINLNIEITPYSNRVIIPKIGKNIPLIDIKNKKISGKNELNNIFMKELEDGIVRYPGSSKPGEKGNSFIFGHSSNFPWIKGDYNEVFATLDNVSYGDEIIVYYGQKKYKYKIKKKKVITPGDVSILKREKDKSEITLMTCWPVGTTLNRLIVIGELIEE